MALQFDMSKNNWQQDLMLQNEDNPYFALGENLGDAGAVVGQKLFPEGGKNVGKNLLAAALAVPGAVGATGLAIKKGSKGLQQKIKKFKTNIKGTGKNISTGIKNTGRKVKQTADTAVDLFIGDKDMLDQFEGSQDSTLMKAWKQRKLKAERDAVSLTPSTEMSDKYVTERPQDVEFGEVDFGLPSKMYRKTTPMPELEPLPEFKAPIAKPAASDYIIQEEMDRKAGRDRFNQMIQPSRLYSPKEAAAREAMLNQNFGPLQSVMNQSAQVNPIVVPQQTPMSNEMLRELMGRNKIRPNSGLNVRRNNPY